MPRRLNALGVTKDAVVLVAEVDGAVVGVITCHVFATIHSTAPAALLTALVVAEQARGSGVGRQLVARVEERARGEGRRQDRRDIRRPARGGACVLRAGRLCEDGRAVREAPLVH